jgi:hypothetical protein
LELCGKSVAAPRENSSTQSPQVPPARSGQSLGTRADCSRAQPIAKQTQLFLIAPVAQ